MSRATVASKPCVGQAAINSSATVGPYGDLLSVSHLISAPLPTVALRSIRPED